MSKKSKKHSHKSGHSDSPSAEKDVVRTEANTVRPQGMPASRMQA